MPKSSQSQIKLEALQRFKDRDRFSVDAWNYRGLNPSSDEIIHQLNQCFNTCAAELINGVKYKAPKRELKGILKSNLSTIDSADYDTEEREFIYDLFAELSEIIGIDFRSNLNKWLYGSLLTTLAKFSTSGKQAKIIETISQPCQQCGVALETHILEKERDIPDTDWLVVNCHNCNELNLISPGPDVKESSFGNYQWVANIRKDEFTYEEAGLRQIRQFRT